MRLSLTTRVCVAMTAVTLLLLAGCASLQEATNIQSPKAEITNVRLDNLDLEKIGLLLDLRVNNPNALGIRLSKLDYDFIVESNSLMKGVLEKGLQVAARSSEQISLPLALQLANLWQAIQQVAQQDHFRYTLDFRLTFALPVLGNVELPLQKSGELPVLRLPTIKVVGLKPKELSLSRANLELALQVSNPNFFSLLLNQFNYDFRVDNRSWANGKNDQPLRLDAKQGNEVRIPISLNFLEMGTALYRLIRSRDVVNYQLTGQFDFGSSEPFLKSLKLPVDLSGRTQIFE
jgi:LEA14-like dessication related protein